MLRKLMILVFLLIPISVFGQDSLSSIKKPSREIVFSNFSSGDPNDYISLEFRWGTNSLVPAEKAGEKSLLGLVRLVPGVELEYFHDSANLADGDMKVDRYNQLTWLKGYIVFRPEKTIRLHMGLAAGLYNGTAIMRNISSTSENEAIGAARNINFAFDVPIGLHFYPHRRVVITTTAKFWSPSLNCGFGFIF